MNVSIEAYVHMQVQTARTILLILPIYGYQTQNNDHNIIRKSQ